MFRKDRQGQGVDNDQNGPKRHQMHHLAHRHVFLFFCNRVLWILTVFLLYLGYIYLIIALGRLGRAAMTKADPNDARCVVWPIGRYFFFCNCVLWILLTNDFFILYLG